MNNAIEMMPLPRFNKRMDMVGHNAPRDKRIPFVVEAQQGILHQFSRRDCKVAATMPRIKCRIRRLDPLSGGQLCKLLPKLRRKAVRETKDDVLNEIGRVQMRQVASRTPAGTFRV